MSNSHKHLSKFLSLVLRHKPQILGLTLNEGGWVRVDDLLQAAARAGKAISRQQLEQIVAHGSKPRFSFSEDGEWFRANYGHSIDVRLDYTPAEPPQLLYHGTAERFLASIREHGLLPQKRLFVHLTTTAESARAVGKRHGKPVVLTVKALEMYRAGHAFFRPEGEIWLTKEIPPAFILFP